MHLEVLPPLVEPAEERDFFIDNLLVRIHYIIVMIKWTGLAPWEFEFPFPGSLTSTFLGKLPNVVRGSMAPSVDHNKKVTSGGASYISTVESKKMYWARPRTVAFKKKYVSAQVHVEVFSPPMEAAG